ncbi:MAG: hypothetical protein EZS28_047442, partial [Streblomastix strix]
MIQLRFEQELLDTIFGNINCPSDINSNEMDKLSQSEDYKEAKDAISIQDEKGKHMEMYKQNGNENAAKVKVSLIKGKQKENHNKIDKQSQSDDSSEFETTRLKKERGRLKLRKKIKVQQPRKEKNLTKMIEDQTRNLMNGTTQLQSKLEVKKERNQFTNKSKVLRDNHTSHLTLQKGESLTIKSTRMGLNVDNGMSNHPTLRLKQFSLVSISSQLPLSLDTNGTRQLNGRSSSSILQTLDRQMLSTQDGGNTLQGGTYFQGDGTNLGEAQQKRSQTKLFSYQTVNVDYVPPSTQGQHVFTLQIYDANSQQHDMIHDQNLITAGNTFLSQQTMEIVDFSCTLLQGSLVGKERTLGHGLEF